MALRPPGHLLNLNFELARYAPLQHGINVPVVQLLPARSPALASTNKTQDALVSETKFSMSP